MVRVSQMLRSQENKIGKKKERPPNNSPKAAHVRRRDIVKTTKYEIDSCIGRRIREED